MKTLDFTVPGIAVPAARCRTSNGHFYLPAKSRKWQGLIEIEAGHAMFGAPPTLDRLYVRIDILSPYMRGDLDNYAKNVLDAMQGVVYKNDSQIDCLKVIRMRQKVAPCIRVHVMDLTTFFQEGQL